MAFAFLTQNSFHFILQYNCSTYDPQKYAMAAPVLRNKPPNKPKAERRRFDMEENARLTRIRNEQLQKK